LDRLKPDIRIGPRHPRLAATGFRFARWLAAKTMGAAGFHQLGSEFAAARIAHVRAKLARGETVYLAGLGAPGTHNSGLALVEVTQAHGPRLIVNNEEERFSGNKHTTEYPKLSVEAVVATLREMGREIGDVDAWLTSWDYPTLAGTMARSVLEEMPQSFKLLRTTEATGFDGRRQAIDHGIDAALAAEEQVGFLAPEGAQAGVGGARRRILGHWHSSAMTLRTSP